MRILHQKLHLQHHTHTGKLLHHRHTSYRGLAVVLVLVAACMGGLSYMQRVAADELFSVSASVHVPRPQSAPTIVEPADNTTLTVNSTRIIGSCPVISPQVVVNIYIDAKQDGTAACDGDNNFSYAATFTPGNHIVTAVPVTIDADHGPASDPLHLTVNAPALQVFGGQVSSTASFISLTTPQLDWYGTVTGNEKQYRLLVEWGDGNYDSITVKPGPQHLQHRYARLASYNLTIGLRDSAGHYQYQQVAIANGNTAAVLGASLTGRVEQPGAADSRTIIGLYGLFVTVVAVCALVRLHASSFAYADIKLIHHAR